ncbi:MAG TPA: hypothetical protein VFQ53_15810 [Kofleriaceae bacterium]|nr:hypothetical protein [Kofleriaceae bacterium]
MRTLTLRRTLASIALSAPLTLPGCVDTSGCPEAKQEQILLAPTLDAELAALVQSCKTDQNCEPLCAKVYERKYGYPADGFTECALTADTATNRDLVIYTPEVFCVGGRRPAGYRSGQHDGDRVGAYLAQQAELEAASVRAFADLHADLRALGAPASLVRAVIAAAADEVRHAATCELLARRHGGSPELRMIEAAPRRSARALAVDNLVEGCIRETYGAVLAGYQARAARDPEVRAAMQQIALDEAKHAALSWKLDAWLRPQLSADDRRALHDAAEAARDELALEVGECDGALRDVAGLPDAETARGMLAQLETSVWSAI